MSDPATGHDPAQTDPAHGHGAAATGHGDGHGHGEEALGPIDIVMWGVGLLGVALGLLVAVCVAFSVGIFQAPVPLPF